MAGLCPLINGPRTLVQITSVEFCSGLEGLMGPLGKVEKVELHAKKLFLCGIRKGAELEYEKLIKVCFICKRLTHEQLYYPMQEAPAGESRDSRGRHREVMRSEVAGSSRQRVEELGERKETKRGQRSSRTSKLEQAPRRTTNPTRRRMEERKEKNDTGDLHKFGYQKIHIVDL
ncbi:hypothetical protein F2Q70_00042916 [Brassica cretica]|uniref:Uncharacterized protein n=1 Tax=Brassica cretica TaxID=69181 RepID=A0A8S9KP04_BRACR|nr:hypothetical protein F2Q70_00042916 [Brassica cretica]